MCKQVSRLGFILLGRLPASLQWLIRPFVGFTVTGVARNSHPYSLGGISPPAHCCADTHAIHLTIL
jgi:hypothetical protein